MTEADQEPKREGAPDGNKNNLKHGAYAYRDHGDKALNQEGRSRMQEIRELAQTPEGAIDLLRSRVVDAEMLVELLISDLGKQVNAGAPLKDIDTLHVLASYQNSAVRALSLLIEVEGKKPHGTTAAMVLDAIRSKDDPNKPRIS